MPRLTRKIPAFRLHKASGQAIVNLDGRRIYLGPLHLTGQPGRVRPTHRRVAGPPAPAP
jgi:hypothetical protein